MKRPRFEIFPSHHGWPSGYYWRLRSRNGRILAVGAEPFSSIAAAKRGINTAHNTGEFAEVKVTKR